MPAQESYGVLSQASDQTLEFTVEGRLLGAWKLGPPITSMPELFQRCLTNLGRDGWRPISHQPNPTESIVLARVPYPAGSKLSVFGTLRFLDEGTLVLTVSGAVMQRWTPRDSEDVTLAKAIGDLERQGWRVHRRYRSGATVVRG